MRHVIVGSSAAGIAAAEAIRKRDPIAEVVMLSAEPRPPYYRPLIPYLIYGEKPEREMVREPRLMPRNLDVRLNVRATDLDLATHTLILADHSTGGSETFPYDRLLIATGASPIRPDIPGLDGPGVFTLRTWEDAMNIAKAAGGATHAVVLGAGRIGMKAAFALRHLGVGVTVIELLSRIVPQQLDAASAAIFAEAVLNTGIVTILGHTIAKVNRRGKRTTSAVLDDGRRLIADLVVVGVGVRPNLELAVSGGLRVNRGLLVDDHLRTRLADGQSAPDVFAAGDVVETTDIVTGESIVSGIWTNAATMGRIAGDNMAGGNAVHEGAFSLLNAMELGGLPVISVGDIHREPGDGVEVFAERRGSNYRKMVFRGNRLIGLVLVGEIERAGVYQTLIREKADVSALRRELLGPRFHYGHYVHAKPKVVDRYVRVG